VVCGAPFSPHSGTQKICSKPCRKKRAKAQIMAWFKANRKDMLDYWVRYHLEHREARNQANLRRYYRKKAR